MIELDYVEVHQPYFLAGKNFGTKLDTKKLSGLKLYFHPDKSMITVEWNGKVGFFHWMNAANNVPANPADIGSTLKKSTKPDSQYQSHPVVAGIAAAQVETPAGHVFKGKGAGRSRDVQ